MTLKVKSAIISFGSIIFIVAVMGFIIYTNIITDFQTIENQRVEQNIKRLEYILKDKVEQLDSKLSDWATWDDTYNFIQNPSQVFIDTNISKETFQKLGVDDVLFINKEGGLVLSFNALELDHVDNIYSQFSTGSALLDTKRSGYSNKGLLLLHNHILIFSVQDILKSDGMGTPAGKIIFAKHFDSMELDSLKDLTQFNTIFIPWRGNKPQKAIEVLNDSTIAGYYTLHDVYNTPIGILRADITRDITSRGREGMTTLILVLIGTGLVASFLNYGLMNGAVLKKILAISSELKDIGNAQLPKQRLKVGNTHDELSQLSADINTMLENIESSRGKLAAEVGKRESLIELIHSIVVMLDENSHISMINQHGCEILGYKRDEIIGKNWIDMFIIPEEKEMIKRRFAELMQASTSNNTYIENTIITKTGTRLVYGWHNTVIKNTQGIITATLSIGNDISEEKEKERLKEEYTITLKRMNDAMIGRELKMIELKKRITELEKSA